MLDNLFSRAQLLGFARKNAKAYETKRIATKLIDEATAEGWRVAKKRKKFASVVRDKKKSDLLESRAWTLLYRMGFETLSGKNGCRLAVSQGSSDGPKDQIDVVVADAEVAIAVECKSSNTVKKDPSLPDWLSRFGELKKRFATAIRSSVSGDGKRHVGMVVFTWDIVLTEHDHKRAEEHGVILFDLAELEYFESLVKHLGFAARYQFLCEIFSGRQIKGLEVRVPALKTKVGGNVCYTFSIRPEYLLKISYVAHRAKGKAIDVDMYQRMISRSRLRKISKYISGGGTFPTNIVVNVREKRFAEFQRGEQKDSTAGALFGWLVLRPAYGCAWVIDGQHRLFAYSGHEHAERDSLNVLAYEALSSGEQAQMFVDINSEQRKVKRSLLVELDADLKWNSGEEDDRIQAIISKAGLALDSDLDSPLRNRILLADVKRTETRCISLTSISSALGRQGFFVVSRKKDFTEYGPLWRTDPQASLKRTIKLAKAWFSTIAETAPDWWLAGAGPGGGLAMNNGVTVCLNVLRSVMEHIGFSNLSALDNEDLVERVQPFGKSLAGHFARLSADARQRFRQLQGSDGQITGTRQCQEAIHGEFPKFAPPQLIEWIEARKKNYNDEGRKLIDEIETTLQKHVLEILKSEHDASPDAWWWDGVPTSVRKKIDYQINESAGKTGSREQNFHLIQYRDVVMHQWDLFKDLFGYAAAGGGKEKQTKWIVEVGDMRNIVMHPTRQQFLTPEQLQLLQGYATWLRSRLRYAETGVDSSSEGLDDEE